jgi:D-alanine-D-alanine ligase-like ATP-grasp enzyme
MSVTRYPGREINLCQLPVIQGEYRFLTQEIKQEIRAGWITRDNKNFLNIPANLPPETIRMINSDIKRIIKSIGCRDMIRIDTRSDSSGWYYLEVNVNPKFSRFRLFGNYRFYTLSSVAQVWNKTFKEVGTAG